MLLNGFPDSRTADTGHQTHRTGSRSALFILTTHSNVNRSDASILE